MTGFFAFVNGHRITKGSVSIPYYGNWSGDFTVADPDAITGQVTVVLGGLTLTGTVYRAATFAGASSLRIVGGAGGWSQPVKSRAYYLAGGVPLIMVLRDLAAEVGETVNLGQSATVGTAYVRLAPATVTAGDLLRELAGQLWYVDAKTGITMVLASRSSSAIISPYQIIDYDGATGLADIATENVQDWMPGNTFDGSVLPGIKMVGLSTIVVDNDGKLRVRVLAAAPGTVETLASDLDRLWAPFRRLVQVETFPFRLYGTYEYTIQATDGSTVDASPNDTTTGCPQVNHVELRADTIATQVPTVGNICHVQFINGDATKPKCVWCAPAPQSVAIDGGGPAVVRVGDTVNAGYLVTASTPGPGGVAGYYPGTIAGLALANTAANAMSPPGVVVSMTGAQTTSGSSTVTCGG